MSDLIQLIPPDKLREYTVFDKPYFEMQVKARSMALIAAAMDYWVTLVKSEFSNSTQERYLESAYWSEHGDRVELGVMPDTLADLLEFGQDSWDMTRALLRGKAKAVIPLDVFKGQKRGERGTTHDGERPADVTTTSHRTAFNASVASLKGVVDDMPPDEAYTEIRSGVMGMFSRSSANTTMRPKNVDKVYYKGTGAAAATLTPASTWRHPGIRARLLGNAVTEFIKLNRDSFIEDLFSDNGQTQVKLR